MATQRNSKVAFPPLNQYGGWKLLCFYFPTSNFVSGDSSPHNLVLFCYRVKQCTEENIHLVKRIKALQTQNQTLVTQLKKLQSVLARGTAKTAQPATCLMVLLLSMALVMAPNLRLNQSSPSSSDSQNDKDLSQSENKVAPLAG